MSFRGISFVVLYSFTAINMMAQVYVHPFAEKVGEDAYLYYLDANKKVVSGDGAYALTRTVQKDKKRKPYRFETRNRAGQLLEQGEAEHPDPIFKRYAGSYLSFHTNGDTALYQPYKNGQQHGSWLEFSSTGEPIFQGEYHKGSRVGNWSYYYKDGQVRRIERYKDDRPNGTWEEFYPNGALRWRLSFVNGIPIGVETYYYEDGAVERILTYEDQLRSGSYIGYHLNGGFAEQGQYLLGKEHGAWKAHHANGALKYSGEYQNGQRLGEWIMLTDTGDTLLFGDYNLKGFTGRELGYSARGQRVYEMIYDNGIPVRSTLFDELGNCLYRIKDDEQLLRSCNDSNRTAGYGRYMAPEPKGSIEDLLNNQIMIGVERYESLYGVYRFSVNRKGKVNALEVITSADAIIDKIVLGSLQNIDFIGGSYYGYPAGFTNECSVRLEDDRLIFTLGRAYFDDAVLLQQSHVPLVQHWAHAVVMTPEFLGGDTALLQWMSKEQRYPEFALQHQRSGESVVQFTVEASGILSGIHIAKNAYPSLDYEALRATQAMPLWKPGEKEGKEVRAVYKLPYRFTLR